MRRGLLLIVSAVVALGTLELAIRLFDLFKEEQVATRERDQPIAAESDTARYLLHPLLGFAGNPAYERALIGEKALSRIFPDGPSSYYLRNSRIGPHGFPSEHPDYAAESDGFHVGIFGGSVAEFLATIGGETLIEELERRAPELRGRVRVFNGAIGGYKQPQQLIALILLTLQGVRFDAIVNLDGFNEAALSSSDATVHYNPLFPSRLHYLFMLNLGLGREVSSASTIERYGEVIRTQRRVSEWRAVADRGFLGRSELVRSVLGRAVLYLESRATRLEQELQNEASPPPSLAAYAPACLRDREDGCWDLIADIWETSSLQMAAIADQIGARYVHALQPNQYDEGSKILSDREREIAYDPESNWPAGVRRVYPLLRARIPGMLARGVSVLDLTQLFASDRADVYVDVCCHYNLHGTNALAAAIADRILQTQPTPAAGGP